MKWSSSTEVLPGSRVLFLLALDQNSAVFCCFPLHSPGMAVCPVPQFRRWGRPPRPCHLLTSPELPAQLRWAAWPLPACSGTQDTFGPAYHLLLVRGYCTVPTEPALLPSPSGLSSTCASSVGVSRSISDWSLLCPLTLTLLQLCALALRFTCNVPNIWKYNFISYP